MGSLMSPVLAVLAKDGTGKAVFPTTVDNAGKAYVLSRGQPYALDMSGFPAREYRGGDGGVLFVVQQLAVAGARVLVALWVPSNAKDDQPALYKQLASALSSSGAVQALWPSVYQSDGVFEFPSLESDAGAIATAVKGAWPAGWRRYLDKAGEHPAVIDPTTGTVTSAAVGPTGVCILGCVLA